MPERKSPLYAIAKLAARQAREMVKNENTASNDVIDFIPLLPDWKQGVFKAGEVVSYEDVPYRCMTDHDSSGDPSWNPRQAASQWANYHGTDRAHALPYHAPTGAHDAYQNGEWMIWEDGQYYLCISNAVVHSPDILPSAWTKME